MSSSDRKDHRHFTCLPKLPAEIRRRIWKHAAFISRNIDIWSPYRGDMKLEGMTFQCNHFLTFIAPPPLLHISSEARAVGLKYYSLAFGTSHLMRFGFQITAPPHIYVNWDVDVICPMDLKSYSVQTLKDLCNHAEIQHLALNVHDDTFSQDLNSPLKSIILYRSHVWEHGQLPFYYSGFDISFDLYIEHADRSSRRELVRYQTKLEDLYAEAEGLMEARRLVAVENGEVAGEVVDNGLEIAGVRMMLPRPVFLIARMLANGSVITYPRVVC